MENPIPNLEDQPEPISQQCDQQDDQNSGVNEVLLAKSSENGNQDDNKPDTKLRSQSSPSQENNSHVEIAEPNQGNEEDNQQINSNPSQEDKIEGDAAHTVNEEEQVVENKTEDQAGVIQQIEDSKEQANYQPSEPQEGDIIASSSAPEDNIALIKVSSTSPETNEDPNKVESPGQISRLKERSPQLKLVIASPVQECFEQEAPLNSATGQGTNQEIDDIVSAGIKRSLLTISEVPDSPNVKTINSTTTLLAKEEENKNEPPSATQPSQKARLSLEDFHKITSVGKGSYGEVFLVKKISNNKLYALKAIDKNFMKKEKKEHQVYVEREVLLKLNHPNIIRLYSSFQDKIKLYFVLEYVSGGEFSDYLRVQGKLTKDQIIFFAAEIINILEYLHHHGVAHRDMKPENLLLTPEGHLKCIDFGTAKFLASDKRTSELFTSSKNAAEENPQPQPAPPTQKRGHRSTFVGTAQYVSPEMLDGSDCGAPADLWALGCMIYLMTVGQFPFSDTNEYLIFQKIKAATVNYPQDMDLEIKDLIQKLLVKDANMRLGAGAKGEKHDYEGLKAHTLFKGIDFNKIHEQKPPMTEIASPHKMRRSHDFEPNGLATNPQQARKHFHSDDLSTEPKEVVKEVKESKTVEFPNDKAIRVILSGLVLKKTGWLFYRPRQLILNSKPRLVYYDPDSNQLKGEIPLAPTTKAELESKTKFIINTPNKKFVFKEMEHSAEKWVEIVNAAVQQLYAKKPEN